MFKNRISILSQSLLALSAIAITTPVQANELANTNLDQLDQVDPMAQVTSVSQLRDVSPTDWAYEALRSLVERYGCIVGYPDSTFRGNRALSRYEFAAGLNACMQQMERLIAASEAVLKEDIAKLQRLMSEFEAELAALGARVDNLEGRVAFLEDHQFSTTTKLYGEVALTLAQAFGDDAESQAVLNSRVRLQLTTTFTGKDALYTRLTSGNVGNSFKDEIGGTNEGRFAYDGQSDHDLTIDRLHYYFPINKDLKAYVMANAAGHWFYADTFNNGLEAGGGSRNALTRFGERNPLYRLGGLGQGFALTYKPDAPFELSAGYLAPNGSDPSDGNGLFNGSYSAMAQLIYKPTDTLKFGFNYLRGYNTGGSFNLGGTGTSFIDRIGDGSDGVESDSFGIQAQYDITPKFSIRAWGGYIDADVDGGEDAEVWTYALALAFPDLGKEGALGYILAGAEPYVGNADENETPFHIEVAYRYPLTDGIAITPGLIILTNPDQGASGDPVYIGTLRTVFNF